MVSNDIPESINQLLIAERFGIGLRHAAAYKTEKVQWISVSVCQCISVSVCQWISVSVNQCVSALVSVCQCVSVSVCQCISVSVCQCISVSVCQCVSSHDLFAYSEQHSNEPLQHYPNETSWMNNLVRIECLAKCILIQTVHWLVITLILVQLSSCPLATSTI